MHLRNILSLTIGLLFVLAPVIALKKLCTDAIFSNISIKGGQIINISTSLITNFSAPASAELSLNHYPEAVIGLDFCETNITYTHAGQNDSIITSIWLPLNWNGRLMGIGGGGWMTGYYFALSWPASKGYVAVMTDGGHGLSESNSWGLKSPGNIDWVLLQDFASIALDDAATLAKATTDAFYGRRPTFSYFSGCSTGGRQGYMMAQRYPEQYDGILAAAPGINWDRILLGMLHPQVVMNKQNAFPPLCELDAFTATAISACDELDGVKDGFLLDPWKCPFSPSTIIGQPYNCSTTGLTGIFSSEGAAVVKAAWSSVTTEDGRNRNGRPLAYGLMPGAPLIGVANTNCTSSTKSNSTSCIGNPLGVALEWVKFYLAKDAAFDFSNITRRGYDTLFRQSTNQYSSIIGTSDTDLTDFKERGGKLLTWHGLDDQLLSPNGTIEYWEKVREQDPEIDDYYRFFAAPGVLHCSAGSGWFPGDAMKDLVAWVEKKIAPERLDAKTVGGNIERRVKLCKWPTKLKFKGGDAHTADSYTCTG